MKDWNVLTEASLFSGLKRCWWSPPMCLEFVLKLFLYIFIIYFAWFSGVGRPVCHCPHVVVGGQLLEVGSLLPIRSWRSSPSGHGRCQVPSPTEHLTGLWRGSLLKEKNSVHNICVLRGVWADYTNALVVRGHMFLKKLFSYTKSCILKFHYVILAFTM